MPHKVRRHQTNKQRASGAIHPGRTRAAGVTGYSGAGYAGTLIAEAASQTSAERVADLEDQLERQKALTSALHRQVIELTAKNQKKAMVR